MRVALGLFLLILLSGCERSHPEDKYKGSQHWITVESGTYANGDSRLFEYDLGSVRRTRNEVLVNYKVLEDQGYITGLSKTNEMRKNSGLPLIESTTIVLDMNCRTRRVSATWIEQHFSDGTQKSQPDHKNLPVPPDTAVDRIFDALCE